MSDHWQSYVNICDGSKHATCMATSGHFEPLKGGVEEFSRRQGAAEREWAYCVEMDEISKGAAELHKEMWKRRMEEIEAKKNK